MVATGHVMIPIEDTQQVRTDVLWSMMTDVRGALLKVLTDWIENGEGVPLDMSPLKMIIRMEIYKKILFLFMVESWVLPVR
jgi:hypothetical protein